MVVTHERTATALDRIADALDTLVRPGLPTKKPERRSGLDRNGPAETRDVTQADIQGQQLADGRASGLDINWRLGGHVPSVTAEGPGQYSSGAIQRLGVTL